MKYNIIITYLNYELRILIFSIGIKSVNLVYDELVCEQDLLKIDNDVVLDNIKSQLHHKLMNIKSDFNNINPHIYLVIDGETEANNTPSNDVKVLKMKIDFDKKHKIEAKDLYNFDKEAFSKSVKFANKTYSGYLIEGFIIDGSKDNFPLGKIVKNHIEVIGSAHYIDKRIYEIFHELLNDSYFDIKGFYDADYLLKKIVSLKDKHGLIEISRKHTKFFINKDDKIQNIITPIGLINFFNNTYATLLKEEKGPVLTKEAVFFLKKHFVLDEIAIDALVNDAFSYNNLVKVFKTVLIDYFSYFYRELAKNNLNNIDFQLIIDGYENNSLYDIINNNTNFKVTKFNVNNDLNVNFKKTKYVGEFNDLNIYQLKALVAAQNIINYRYWESR